VIIRAGPHKTNAMSLSKILYSSVGGWVRQKTTVVGSILLVRR